MAIGAIKSEREDGLLTESGQFFFDHTDVWMAVADEQLRILSVNPAWAAGFGLSPPAAVGQLLAEMLPGSLIAHLQTLKVEAPRGARPLVQLATADRGLCWLAAECKHRGDRVLISLSDVTGDQHFDPDVEAARQSRDRLLHDAHVGTWRFNPDTEEFRFSPELMSGYGDNPPVVPKVLMDSLCHPDDLESERVLRERITTEGGRGEMELRLNQPDSPGWQHLRVRMRSGRQLASGAYEMYGLTQEVTELARARDQAHAATEAKSRFLASVSHEIRTPMNGVMGVLHLLKREAVSAGGQKLLDEALACGGMLTQLINDVLDFSKIEADKLELSPEPTSAREAVEGVVSLLGPQADAKGLYLRTEIDPDLDWIMVDPVRLRQCLFNLIGNAVKFTRAGGVEVRVHQLADQRLRVEVQDTGVGIPEHARGRLFQRFEQADGATTRQFGGTGLGLAISKSLAQLMGGDIDFESRENEGSTFWLEIDAPATDAGVAAPTSVPDVSLDGLRVLLVDDNATNRLVGSKMLEALGANVTTCQDGATAIEVMAHDLHDLVLMDINMPGMDGLEATHHIRALSGPAAEVPIIALTANASSQHRENYLSSGVNGVVAKPFSPISLLTEIVRLLDGGEVGRGDVAAA